MDKINTLGNALLDLRQQLDPLDDAFSVLGLPDKKLPNLDNNKISQLEDEVKAILSEIEEIQKQKICYSKKIDTNVIALQAKEVLAKLKMKLWATFLVGYDHSPVGRVLGGLSNIPTNTPDEQETYLFILSSVGPYLNACAQATIEATETNRAPLTSSILEAKNRYNALLKSDGEQLIPEGSDIVFSSKIRNVFNNEIKQEIINYIEVLEEIIEKGRSDEKAGMCYIRNGKNDYIELVNIHTDNFSSPEKIHSFGHEQVSTIKEELCDILGCHIDELNMESAFRAIERDTEKSRTYNSADDFILDAKNTISDAFVDFSNLVPLDNIDPLDIVSVPEHLCDSSPSAYYLPGNETVGGKLVINPHAMIGKPIGIAKAMIIHEAIPGHHAQFEIARRLDLPAYRKSAWFNSFVEGWGLYVEELANEIGLFTNRVSQLGRLKLSMLRATRLVVDTGLHYYGWSKKECIDYMVTHCGLSSEGAASEVERYIEFPAQALSYATGKQKFLDKRREFLCSSNSSVERHQEYRDFHHFILRSGVVPLSSLENAY